MSTYKSACLLALFSLLLCAPLRAQSADGQFGCPARTQFFQHVDVDFSPLNDDQIELWRTRPGLAFEGFDEKKYGFREIAFYRWREPGQGDADSGPVITTADLAVRLVGARGDQWFEWGRRAENDGNPQSVTPSDILSIQAEPGADAPEQISEAITQSFIVRLASPDSALPVFLLEFGYSGGVNGTVVNRMILDARSGKPQIGRALQCLDSQTANDVCGAPNRVSYDNLSCNWDAAAADFRCSMTSPFGAESPRLAQKPFYLFSSKPAPLEGASARDLGILALELNRGRAPANSMIVADYGSVTLLARYKDLLPGKEIFIFASPGAGAALNAHFSLVTISAQEPPTVEDIPKSVISGEKTDEPQRPAGYSPLANDHYRTASLVDRAGFHAFQVVMTAEPSADQQGVSPATHIVYWVGLEAVDGRLIASAMRVASDGLNYGSCAQDAHDGSAISIEQQTGMAAATVHVRPPDVPVNTSAEEAEQSETLSGCVWIGALYWKSETGFQVQKTDDDCAAGVPQVAISDNGRIKVKAQVSVEQ